MGSKTEVPSDRPKSKIIVRVPATAANLGAGFDVMGLALSLYNTFTVSASATTVIEVEGANEDVPRDESNLFYRAFAHLCSLAGETVPPVRVHMQLDVPQGRGLGSSATAVVGGLLAANALLGEPFQKGQLLGEAVRLEHGKHADNVAPALLGGLVVNAAERGQTISVRIPWPEVLRAVVFTPDFGMDTVRGRALMPGGYMKADVVFSTSRVALFLAALTQRHYELLSVAMQDKLHQPYRAKLFPLFPKLIKAAEEGGAHGACLSGGGSSVLALATERQEAIGAAMQAAAEAAGIRGRLYLLNADPAGAQVITEAAG